MKKKKAGISTVLHQDAPRVPPCKSLVLAAAIAATALQLTSGVADQAEEVTTHATAVTVAEATRALAALAGYPTRAVTLATFLSRLTAGHIKLRV